MNDDTRIPLDEDSTLTDALRWQLRAQRRDVAPPVDLWPGIAARLAAAPVRPRWKAPRYALAASLALAVVAGAMTMHRWAAPAPVSATATRQAAQSMTREYDRALDAVPVAKSPELAPAFAELDRSARQIRRALQRDPDSRLLLEQLRRTYSLRLALSQRAVVG
jgi:hypothetical protein